MVALTYVLLHDEPDAEHWLRIALQLDKQNAEAWYDLGRVLYDAKRYPEAGESLDRALHLRPEDVRAETYRGLIVEVAGDLVRAEAAYRKAIADQQRTGKPNSLSFRSLGILLRERGDFSEAERMLQRATEIAPADAENHAELGSCYAEQQLWAKARVELEAAIRLRPTRPAWHFQLGRVDHALGLTPQAELEFLTARTQIETIHKLGSEQQLP